MASLATVCRIAFLAALVTMAAFLPTAVAQTASNVYTTYNIYNAAANSYSLSGLYCDTWDGSQSLAWRSEYPWTAFCGPVGGPVSESICGKCLQVTNQDTNQNIKVRIVDQCSNGGLDLDQPAFNQIDSDGQGYAQGHMLTTYTFVDC